MNIFWSSLYPQQTLSLERKGRKQKTRDRRKIEQQSKSFLFSFSLTRLVLFLVSKTIFVLFCSTGGNIKIRKNGLPCQLRSSSSKSTWLVTTKPLYSLTPSFSLSSNFRGVCNLFSIVQNPKEKTYIYVFFGTTTSKSTQV